MSETLCATVLPTLTLPKLTLAGLIVSCGCVPVALKPTVSGEPGALLAIEILPVAVPDEAGENFAVRETICPALMVVGTDKPLMLKPVPEATACEIVTLAVPEFVSVIGTEPLLPTRTLPKLRALGLAERTPGPPVDVFALTSPVQPDRLRIPGTAARASKRRNALYKTRYLVPSSEHTRRSLILRTCFSGLKQHRQ